MKNNHSELLNWLLNARKTMWKRSWIPSGHISPYCPSSTCEKYQEIQGGSIPIWWIDQEIDRLWNNELDTAEDQYLTEKLDNQPESMLK